MSNWKERIAEVLLGEREADRARRIADRQNELELKVAQRNKEIEKSQIRLAQVTEVNKYLEILNAEDWMKKLNKEAWKNKGTIVRFGRIVVEGKWNRAGYRLYQIKPAKIQIEYYKHGGGGSDAGYDPFPSYRTEGGHGVQFTDVFVELRNDIVSGGSICIRDGSYFYADRHSKSYILNNVKRGEDFYGDNVGHLSRKEFPLSEASPVLLETPLLDIALDRAKRDDLP